MKKRLVSLLLCMTLLMTISSSVYASQIEDNNDYAEEEYAMEGTPSWLRWSNVALASAVFGASNGTAKAASDVLGYSKVTKIVVYTYFQKKVNGSWENLSYVIDSKSGNFIDVSRSTSSGIVKGYTYRARIRIYAYVGATYELVTIHSNESSY